ncbi:MAG: trimeric intracellular cation channel family protein [Roseburia sp.]|nr:trimeric intracellular cation channel family protein [Anaeroplasma bactoclasticum]MCM1195474.1 trimeric intracellular cation channel family protein [Roseburia sp.]MCM1555952.1 trimeric intracellular cation channel family protein [Anaeroplasma bactoclasticum]
MDIDLMITILEYIGTVAFAISGALIAIENRMDVLGVMILGCTTAVGGGLFRDLIIGRSMPLMFENPSYVIVAAVTTLIVFIVMYVLKDIKVVESKAYLVVYNIIDSLGLGVFVVVGSTFTKEFGITNHFMIIFCAVLTAVGGGMLRDIMSAHIPAIFRKHIYCVAAIVGAVLFYLITLYSNMYSLAAILTIILVVGIRYLAFHFKLNLPKVKINEE